MLKDGGHGAIASPTSSDRQTMGIVLGSDNNPTRQNIEGRHLSQSYTQVSKKIFYLNFLTRHEMFSFDSSVQ